MEINNKGSTRLVILFNTFVIKIPMGLVSIDNTFYGRVFSILEGWKANRMEYIWSKSKHVDFICPVKYSFLFSFIIIMERAEPITRDEFFNLEQYNFEYEHKLDSYGRLGGKIIVVDYG